MYKKTLEKLNFFFGIIFFYNQLKKKKLVSSEPEFYILKNFIKKNNNVIDIGANIGLHTIVMAKCGFTVHSFEPDPIHFNELKKNLEHLVVY